MASSIYSFLLVAIAAMAASAVAASVVFHFENAEHTPAEKFLSAVTIQSGSKHLCSGVILDERWIITTAHCIEKYTKDQLQVKYYVNGHRFNNVEAIVLHPEYNHERLVNNVALIKVKTEIDFDVDVQPARLPTVETEEDELAYAIGWEKENENVSKEHILFLLCFSFLTLKFSD